MPSAVVATMAALALGRAIEKVSSPAAAATVSETAASGTPASSATLLMMDALMVGVKSLTAPAATIDAVMV